MTTRIGIIGTKKVSFWDKVWGWLETLFWWFLIIAAVVGLLKECMG